MSSPTLNIILRSGFLQETQRYCAISGAQDKRIIDQFIRGLKNAGLWDSLIEAWPLCAVQNAGTGSTAYGLKGISNGTLTNGPTWGASGITFATDLSTGRTRHIACPWTGLYDIRSNSSAVIVSDQGDISNVSSVQQASLGSNNTGNTYNGVSIINSGGATDSSKNGPTSSGNVNYASVTNSFGSLPAGISRLWTTQRENNLVGNANVQGNKLIQDTTQIANGSNAAQVGFEVIGVATTTLVLGNARTGASLSAIGTISFAAIFSDWTISPTTLRAILKSTILSGVLP